jgi:DNA-binding PadR family transcriptional regulator
LDIVRSRAHGVVAERLEAKMKMREYAMLAALAHGKKSGYDLSKWFDRSARHFCTAGYSSVYPALAMFEREGLVVHETEPGDRGPERKVYSVTGKGRDVLLEWAARPASDPEVRDEQLVKALSYGMLPGQVARALLEGARARHEEKRAYYEGLMLELEGRKERGEVSGEAYVGTKLTLMRGIGSEGSYVRWCDGAAALVAGASVEA